MAKVFQRQGRSDEARAGLAVSDIMERLSGAIGRVAGLRALRDENGDAGPAARWDGAGFANRAAILFAPECPSSFIPVMKFGVLCPQTSDLHGMGRRAIWPVA